MVALPSVADLLSGQTGYERGAQAFDNGYNGVRGMRVNDLAKSYFTGDPSTRDATLQQIAAIRGAVNGLMAQVLESHLRESFGNAPQAQQFAEHASPQQALDEVVSLLRSYMT